MKHTNWSWKRRWAAVCLAGVMLLAATGCGGGAEDRNLLPSKEVGGQVVNLFSPMEKTDPNAEKVPGTRRI